MAPERRRLKDELRNQPPTQRPSGDPACALVFGEAARCYQARPNRLARWVPASVDTHRRAEGCARATGSEVATWTDESVSAHAVGLPPLSTAHTHVGASPPVAELVLAAIRTSVDRRSETR